MAGLPVPYGVGFGDPDAIQILSARAGEIVPLEVTIDGSVLTAVLPDKSHAFEISIESDDGARVHYVAATEAPEDSEAAGDLATSDGLPRRIPAGGQLIDQRRGKAGDVVIVLIDSGSIDLTVHALVEAVA